jgi:hypothetical protein
MFITRQHPSGARPLKAYPIDTEPRSGKLGYKIGYCMCGCKEPLFIRTIELREVLEYFGEINNSYYNKKLSLTTKLKSRIIKMLGGTIPNDT